LFNTSTRYTLTRQPTRQPTRYTSI